MVFFGVKGLVAVPCKHLLMLEERAPHRLLALFFQFFCDRCRVPAAAQFFCDSKRKNWSGNAFHEKSRAKGSETGVSGELPRPKITPEIQEIDHDPLCQQADERLENTSPRSTRASTVAPHGASPRVARTTVDVRRDWTD
jgi:hypothetical protein